MAKNAPFLASILYKSILFLITQLKKTDAATERRRRKWPRVGGEINI
jgi:hypothetical protein